jgi:hypothetical protein
MAARLRFFGRVAWGGSGLSDQLRTEAAGNAYQFREVYPLSVNETNLQATASRSEMNNVSLPALQLLLAAMLCTGLYGQRIRVGAVGGGDASRDFSERFIAPSPSQAGYEQTSNVRSYAIGPTVEIQLRPRLSFEIDALFKPLRFTQSTVLLDGSRRSVSPATVVTWQFPLLLKYRLRDSGVSPFLVGGPSLRTAGNLNGTNPSSAGVTGGAGVTLPWKAIRFEPSLRYTRWRVDRPTIPGVRTRPDQVEFLLGVTTEGAKSDWKPMHERVSLGALVGASLTDRFRRPDAERRFLAGPQIGFSVSEAISLQINALYSPIVRNVTWEFPVLVRYTASSLSPVRVKPIFELGPTFRTPQEINGSKLSRYGVAAGLGIELPAGPVRVSSLLRYTHWGPESNPARSLVFRNQLQLLAGFSF